MPLALEKRVNHWCRQSQDVECAFLLNLLPGLNGKILVDVVGCHHLAVGILQILVWINHVLLAFVDAVVIGKSFGFQVCVCKAILFTPCL